MRRYAVEDVVSSSTNNVPPRDIMMSYKLLMMAHQKEQSKTDIMEEEEAVSDSVTSNSATHRDIGFFNHVESETARSTSTATTVTTSSDATVIMNNMANNNSTQDDAVESNNKVEKLDQLWSNEAQIEGTTSSAGASGVVTTDHNHDEQNQQIHKPSNDNNDNAQLVVDDLLKGLQDEKMTNVVLVGNDAIPVRANRFVLACRSPVFRAELYHDDIKQQQRDTTVVLPCRGYSSRVLKVLVHYCFTNTIQMQNCQTTMESEAAREVVLLAKCAKRYKVYGMFRDALTTARTVMNQNPPCACIVYKESSSSNNGCPELKAMALEMIQELPVPTLLTQPDEVEDKNKHNLVGVSYLDSSQLQDLLAAKQKLQLEDDELTVFAILQKWYDTTKDPNKRNVLRKCRKFVDLDKIPPPDLLTSVKESGLFDNNLILHAITYQVQEKHAKPPRRQQQDGLMRANSLEDPNRQQEATLKPEQLAGLNYRQRSNSMPLHEIDTSVVVSERTRSPKRGRQQAQQPRAHSMHARPNGVLTRAALQDKERIDMKKTNSMPLIHNGNKKNQVKRTNSSSTSNGISALEAAAKLRGTGVVKERVFVEGAGIDQVNGLYYREDDPTEEEEATYIKRVDGLDLYVLFSDKAKWYIAPCTQDEEDSNHEPRYECFKRTGRKAFKVPRSGWQSMGARRQQELYDPPPRCKWYPSKNASFR